MAETDEDRFETTMKILCYACRKDDLDRSSDNLEHVIDGVMKALAFSQREEVKAWEQEFVPCEHTLGLIQQDNTPVNSKGTSKFSICMKDEAYTYRRSQSMFNV